MPTDPIAGRVATVRAFNRFYTRVLGLLDEHLLGSPQSLTQARILFELSHRPGLTAADLGRELGLDAGYLSRVLSGLRGSNLVRASRSESDARAAPLSLTGQGRRAFALLDRASERDVLALLERLPMAQQLTLVQAMRQVQDLLEPGDAALVLREPGCGDLGWVIHRHGALYGTEYGWTTEFEALVADIVAKFIRDFEPRSERCWIAERNGSIVGSVFVVRHDASTAQLRLLYVEPSARGAGIGARLVEECLRFAKRAGYQTMMLWTNSLLTSARHIYQKAGFTKIGEESHHSFGQDLVGETWTRAL